MQRFHLITAEPLLPEHLVEGEACPGSGQPGVVITESRLKSDELRTKARYEFVQAQFMGRIVQRLNRSGGSEQVWTEDELDQLLDELILEEFGDLTPEALKEIHQAIEQA
jgi:hypothetical protein